MSKARVAFISLSKIRNLRDLFSPSITPVTVPLTPEAGNRGHRKPLLKLGYARSPGQVALGAGDIGTN